MDQGGSPFETRSFRAMVEDLVSETIPDLWWDALRRILGDLDVGPETAARDYADYYEDYVYRCGFMIRDEDDPTRPPPARRLEHSEATLSRFRDSQAQALAIVGLAEFISSEEIAPYLQGVADADNPDTGGGDVIHLSVYRPSDATLDPSQGGATDPDYIFEPFSNPDRQMKITAYQGFSSWEYWKMAEGDPEWGIEPTPHPERWRDDRSSRLFKLKELAHEIVRTTDCLEADAIAFLLADVTFLLPRVRVVREKGGTYDGPITIRVTDRSIGASEVADTYRAALKKLQNQSQVMSVHERDLLLIQFCWSENPDLSWAERFERWNAMTDGRPPFETAKKMKATAHQARRRKEVGVDG